MEILGFTLDPMMAVYAAVLIGPFIQEDAAVIGAASAAAAGHGEPSLLFAFCLAGLIVSDGWKYWVGALAHRIPRFAKLAESPRVQAAREGVLKRLGLTLLAARFVPGTRIPLYVACGVFRAPFIKFLALVAATGALYLALAFALLMSLGAAAGEAFNMYAPYVAVTIVALVLGVAWLRRTRSITGKS